MVLGLEDLNIIKELYELATEQNNTYLRIDTELVRDVFGNSVEEILQTDALPVRVYTEDTIDPRVLEYDLDLDLRTLTLFFSETVDVSTLDTSGLDSCWRWREIRTSIQFQPFR